jgi:hypothetical protein
MRTRIWVVCIVMALALWLASCTPTILADVPPEIVGEWQGQATIIVAWVDQEKLSVNLTIHEDGTVQGSVGDAILTDGSIRNNPAGREYIIVADLDGPIVAAEEIHRDGVNMPLDFDGERFDGGIASTGTQAGGKETMILSAARLVLTPVDAD